VLDILDAGCEMILEETETIEVNGVGLTRDDMNKIRGLINEAYDEGMPTGFVSAFDAD